jgi:hypothetical protein
MFRFSVTGLALAACLAAALSACGGDSTSLLDPLAGALNGTISAKLNGTAFSIDGLLATADYDASSKQFSVGGLSDKVVMSIEADGVSGPGTYPIVAGAVVFDPGSWTYTPSSGSIKITTWSGRHVVGTFSFDVDDTQSSSTSGSARGHVTDGKFDVSY